MRLDLADALRTHPLETFDLIGQPPFVQCLKARNLRFRVGHNEFAAAPGRNTVILTESRHGATPLNTELRLEGARFVINTGVNNTTVVTGLLGRGRCTFFQHH